MNEQLRKFARDSHIDVYGLGKDRANWETALEKYADLIIRECMSNLYLNGYDDAMIQIQRHFGVGE